MQLSTPKRVEVLASTNRMRAGHAMRAGVLTPTPFKRREVRPGACGWLVAFVPARPVSASPDPAPESAGDEAGVDESDTGLSDAVRSEREYVRRRLRQELQREPSDEEMDEWLRKHTEGY